MSAFDQSGCNNFEIISFALPIFIIIYLFLYTYGVYAHRVMQYKVSQFNVPNHTFGYIPN